MTRYESAKEIYKSFGVDTEKAIKNGTIYTDIDFFKDGLIPIITSDFIDSMSDAEFGSRAYSWRKRATIKRNLDILEEKN